MLQWKTLSRSEIRLAPWGLQNDKGRTHVAVKDGEESVPTVFVKFEKGGVCVLHAYLTPEICQSRCPSQAEQQERLRAGLTGSPALHLG
jgi:hypothetical protein